MDAVAVAADLEAVYSRVLALTRDQECCLRAGELGDLQTILLAKDAALGEAQGLLARLKAVGPGSGPTPKALLGRVGELLRDLMAAEERCRALAPPRPSAPPRRQVAAAYAAPRR